MSANFGGGAWKMHSEIVDGILRRLPVCIVQHDIITCGMSLVFSNCFSEPRGRFALWK